MATPYTKDLDYASSVLNAGGIIVCPSEGVYGLSCDVNNQKAIERIIRLKKRDSAKGLILVDGNDKFLKEHADFTKLSKRALYLMNLNWPGPHTFIVPSVKFFNSYAVRSDHTMAFRISSFSAFVNLCDSLGRPLISTSANISGQNAVSELSLLDPEIIAGVDLVLDLPCGGQFAPTSIYDCILERLIRTGPGFKEFL